MKDFADAAGVVAMGFEPQRECLNFGVAFAEVDAVVPDSEGVGASAGEE